MFLMFLKLQNLYVFNNYGTDYRSWVSRMHLGRDNGFLT